MGAIRLLHWKTLIVLGAFFLRSCEGTQRPLTTKPMFVLPGHVIDYRIENPPSTCVCRLQCMMNSSCTAVSLHMVGGNVTCSFSNVVIDLASLAFSTSDHSFIHNVSQPTQESVSSVGTTAATTQGETTSSSTTSSPTTSSSTTSSSTTSSSTTSGPTTSSPTASSSTATTTTTSTSATSATLTSRSTTSSSSTSSSTTRTTSTSTTSTTTTTTPVTNCNWYWDPFNGHCYNQFGSGQWTVDLDWNGAFQSCDMYHNYLVKISSAEELAFINRKYSSDSWIGLKKDSTATFKWVTDSSVPDFTSWATGEPSTGDCVCISSGMWRSRPCSDKIKYICERTAP